MHDMNEFKADFVLAVNGVIKKHFPEATGDGDFLGGQAFNAMLNVFVIMDKIQNREIGKDKKK